MEGKARRGDVRVKKGQMQANLDALMVRIEAAEARVQEIDAMFCEPDYYERTPAEDVRALEEERSRLQGEVTDLMAEWEQTEEKMGSLE